MGEWVVSGLAIMIGVISAWIGTMWAADRLRAAGRAYRKTETLYAAMPDGWSSWFLGGFSGLAVGAGWFRAAAGWTVWMLAGIGLIALGLRLFWRA
jgi:hypothetical protein